MSGQTLIERLRYIRGRAVEYVEWRKAGFPMTDDHDTYPDDLYSAAVRAEAIVPLLDEVLAALSHSPSREPACQTEQDDAKRLDWIERQDLSGLAFGFVVDAQLGVRYVVRVNRKAAYSRSLRGAIDARMAFDREVNTDE